MMVTKIATPEQIEQQGYGISGNIGGQPKTTYYRPDGKVVKLMPDMHTFKRGDETGIRDANFDKGFLPMKPQILEITCTFCGKWHKTQELVDECGKEKAKRVHGWDKKAAKELGEEDAGRISKLEEKMDAIQGLLLQLVKEKKDA